LCKSILFENTRFQPFHEHQDPLDVSNSRFYLVIVQYEDKINAQKLINYIRDNLGGGKIARKKYNFRLAPEEKAFELTGFIRNGVTAFGKKGLAVSEIAQLDFQLAKLDLRTRLGLKTRIPVIVTKNIADLQVFVFLSFENEQ
jgi:hypothetical protein